MIEKRITNDIFLNKCIEELTPKEKIVFLNLYCRGSLWNDGSIDLTRTFTNIEQILKSNINKYEKENKESRRSVIKILNSLKEKNLIYTYSIEPMYITVLLFLTPTTQTRYTKLNVKSITEAKELNLKPTDVIIYHTLKCFSQNKTYTNISLKTIIEYSNISKQSVINSIKALKRKNIIKIDKANNKVNIYYLKNKNNKYFLDYYISNKLNQIESNSQNYTYNVK